MRLYLKDNNTGKANVKTYNRKDVSALFPIADKTIGQLCRENENLLIFPYSIDDSDDRIGESSVLNILNTGDSEKVKISTGNIMGFIGIGNLQVKIQSRFDEGYDDYLFPGLCDVELTSYSVDMVRMAQTGIDTLICKISGAPYQTGIRVIEGKLVERASVCDINAK